MRPPVHSVSIIIFILVTSSTTCGQVNQQYSNCSSSFSCGRSFQDIRFPFWGGNRSPACGVQGFGLRCRQDDYLTIDIANQTFRVLSIDGSNPSLTIASNDLREGTCPDNYLSTELTNSPFSYGRDVENLTLFYSCPINDSQWRNIFTCNINGNSSTAFVLGEPSLSGGFPVDGCQMNITVPVLQRALQNFRRNTSKNLQELLNQGFPVNYSINITACLACERSGGLCWANTTLEIPWCLCNGGVSPYVCQGGTNRVRLIIGVIVAGICISICLVFWYYKYGKHSTGSILSLFMRKTADDQNLEVIIRQYESFTPRRYNYSDIKKMTNCFQDKLGQGGYGNVYKGYLPDSHPVAVKILKTSKGNGEEFVNEVASISRTSHVNIVSLLGFCLDGRKRALVYEFLSNGSLEKYIHQESTPHLGLEKLYEIAIGIAHGLEYLHGGCKTRIMHFDIKPQNILLDEDFCPKISDFGLAKLCTRKESIVSMQGARGTIGYIAPEVFSRSFGGVSYKSDVYSYGMMILEMVARKKNAVNVGASNTSEAYFPQWLYKCIMPEEDLEPQDHALNVKENEIGKKMILVGLWCIQSNPSRRPSMSKVINMLEGSLQSLEHPPKPFLSSPSRSAELPSKSTLSFPSRSTSGSCTTYIPVV